MREALHGECGVPESGLMKDLGGTCKGVKPVRILTYVKFGMKNVKS